MEVLINKKPIEYYFGENIILKSVGKCVKYYAVGGFYIALAGGIIGATCGIAFSLVAPVVLITNLVH